MKNKSQITLYIILGIIMLLIIFLAVSLFKYLRPTPNPPPEINLQPIKNEIETCLDLQLSRALKIIGINGGYIEPEPNYKNIAYWIYNNKINSPDINTIRNEIKKYIKKHIDECINFSKFDYDIHYSKPEIDTLITNNEINSYVNYKLHIIDLKTNKEKILNKVPVDKQSKLYLMLLLSQNITNFEFKTKFLENITMQLASMSLPFNGVKFSCVPIKFDKQKLENTFISLLKQEIPKIYFNKTIKVFNNYDSYERHHFIFNIFNDLNKEKIPLSIIIYPYDIKITIPGLNSKIIPMEFGCLNTYHFTYDISFKAMVVLKSKDYMFRFILPVNIIHNSYKNIKTETDVNQIHMNCEKSKTIRTIYVYDDNNSIINGNVIVYCLNYVCDSFDFKNNIIELPKYKNCRNPIINIISKNHTQLYKQIDDSKKQLQLFLPRLYYIKSDLPKDSFIELRLITPDNLKEEGTYINYNSYNDLRIADNFKYNITIITKTSQLNHILKLNKDSTIYIEDNKIKVK